MNKQTGTFKKSTSGSTSSAGTSTEKKGGGRRSLGTVKKNEKGNVYMQLNKKVEILYDGKKIDLGEYNTLFFTDRTKAEADIDFRVEKGYLSEKAEQVSRDILADEKVKYIVEANLVAE
jgi:hypothetical protein